MTFDWDSKKKRENTIRHGVAFSCAQKAFLDENRIVYVDVKHSTEKETRYFCIGKVEQGVLTVRFTMRGETIGIFGAGFWRKGRKRYEQEKG